jgi:hypothetical protein
MQTGVCERRREKKAISHVFFSFILFRRAVILIFVEDPSWHPDDSAFKHSNVSAFGQLQMIYAIHDAEMHFTAHLHPETKRSPLSFG